jgi:hypothetical protein
MTPLAVGLLVGGCAGIVGTIVVLVNGFACDLWNKENEAYKNCVAKTGGLGCGSDPASKKPQGCDECGKAK